MQSLPTYDSGTALILIAAIVLWATSPAKWQTFKKMAVACFSTFVMVIVLGFVLSSLGYGNGGFFGEVSVLCGIIAALVMGRQHVRSLKKQTLTGAASKDL
jgi:uncharacterized membrane protein